jgi:hypothetical protein
MDQGFAPFGEGVYHRNPDAVEAPGNLIGIFVEFAPRMEPGHNQFQGADPLGGVDVYRDTPAIVLHPDHIITFKNHKNIIAEALHGFIYRIIYNLKDQMMETVDAGGPNIHTRPFPYRLQALKNLDILGRII